MSCGTRHDRGCEMSWEPAGNFLLVRLHTTGSMIEIQGEGKYNGLATVLGVGPKVDAPIVTGDVVMLNGPQGILAHPELGEHIAVVAAPLVLARQVEDKPEVQH